jgi:hypothetical protein
MNLATVDGAFDLRAIGFSIDRSLHATRSMLIILVLFMVSFEDSIRWLSLGFAESSGSIESG